MKSKKEVEAHLKEMEDDRALAVRACEGWSYKNARAQKRLDRVEAQLEILRWVLGK